MRSEFSEDDLQGTDKRVKTFALRSFRFRKICLNNKKRDKKNSRDVWIMEIRGNFDLDFLSFALERWYIYIYIRLRRFES